MARAVHIRRKRSTSRETLAVGVAYVVPLLGGGNAAETFGRASRRLRLANHTKPTANKNQTNPKVQSAKQIRAVPTGDVHTHVPTHAQVCLGTLARLADCDYGVKLNGDSTLCGVLCAV